VAGVKDKVNAEELIRRCRNCSAPRMAAASAKAAAAGVAFLDKASKEPGVTKTTSGMLIKHTVEGKGASPAATDQVKVHYEGRLIDGKVFDSSIQRGEPATFPLNGVIACWTEGVQTMKVGARRSSRAPRISRTAPAVRRRPFRRSPRWCSTWNCSRS
jgi:FKBP-type peptidyl-prolyl cis-trans isomerase